MADKQERARERSDRLRAEGKLSLGLITNRIRKPLMGAGLEVGIPGMTRFDEAELLILEDGITYRLLVRVDHDG